MRSTTKTLLGLFVAIASYVAFDPSAPRITARPTPQESDRALFQDRERLAVAIEVLLIALEDPWHLRRPGESTEGGEKGLAKLREEYRGRYGDAP